MSKIGSDVMTVIKNGEAGGAFANVLRCPVCSALGFCTDERLVPGQIMQHIGCSKPFMIQKIDLEKNRAEIVYAGQEGYKAEGENDIEEL